tara:strand:- start:173 stop:721 length:549 start_codon:yes stop_codon:yes gene_type:complete
MAKRKPYEGADQVEADLIAQLDAGFAQTIRELHANLSTAEASPVYTGFLASSWKVRRNPIGQTDRREDHEPWASIKREHDLPKGREGWKPAGSRPDNPVIDPRFPVGTNYKFRDKDIYIGNTAEYAGYASENPVISQWVQGEAGKIIKDNMREKGKIYVGARPGSGFGKIKPGSTQRYIEPS